VHFNEQATAKALWLANLFETCLDVSTMAQTFQNIGTRSSKTQAPTRLGRSIASARMPSAAKDSSVSAAPFLVNLRNRFEAWVSDTLQAGETDLVSLLLKLANIAFNEGSFPLTGANTTN